MIKAGSEVIKYMEKKRMKNRIKVFLLLLLAAGSALCLSGCGSTETETAVSTPKYTYTAETVCKVEASTGYNTFSHLALNGDKGYFAAGEKVNEVGQTVPCISFVSNKGKVEELKYYKPLSVETGNESRRDYTSSDRIETIKICQDGNLMVIENISSSWSDADSDVKYGSDEYYDAYRSNSDLWIRILNVDGKELSRAELQVGENDYVSFFSAIIDKNGNLLTSRSGGVVAFRTDGTTAYRIDSSNYVTSMATTSDGRPATLAYAGSGRKLRLVDCGSGTFEAENITVGSNTSQLIDGCGEYDLYSTSGSALYGYKLETQTNEKIFSWIDCDIYSNNVSVVSVNKDGSLRALLKSYSADNEKMVLELVDVKREAYSARKDRKHVTLASVSPDRTMVEYIIEFNRSSKDIRVDLVDYSQYAENGGASAAYQKLASDISSGEVPDILDINMNIPYSQYAAAGSFLDLYPYIEKDREISMDNLFENILAALEVDGKLYMATAGFQIYTAAGSSAVVGDQPGISYEDFLTALASMPDGCEGFDLGFDRNSALNISFALEYSKFVDWSSRTCHFDSQEFADLLKFAAKFKVFDREKHEYSSEDEPTFRISTGGQMMKQVILSEVDYTVLETDLLFGGNATITGYPTTDGVGSVISIAGGLAITSGCADPDAAWSFVRTLFTDEYQEKQSYIPVNKKIFEKQLEKLTEIQYEKDNEGNYVLDGDGNRIKKAVSTARTDKGYEDVYAMTEEQAQMFRDAVSTATRLLTNDQSITSIIAESAQAFFSGQKTAEDCAKLIQNRVYIYINERS